MITSSTHDEMHRPGLSDRAALTLHAHGSGWALVLLITEIAGGVCFGARPLSILLLPKPQGSPHMEQQQPLTTLLVHFVALGLTLLGIGSLALLMAWAGRLIF